MEVQVLQEINSQVRKSPPSQGGEVASANTRLLGLKGNSVREPDFSAPSPQNTFPDQAQSQVEPEISSVARAASAYSKAIGDGLNPDELKAVQDLAIKVRSIVTEFLSQSGLEQAANADAVVSTNPEAVQIVTDNLGQTVKQALNLPNVDTDGNADSAVTNEEVPSDEVRSAFSDRKPQISIERITNGAQTAPAEIVTAAPPALQISQAQNAAVENPVNRNPVPEAIDLESDETVSGTPTAPEGEFIGISTGPELAVKPSEIVAASPALQNSQAQNAAVENPVNRNQNSGAAEPAGFVVTPESTEIPDGDFTGIATGRRLVNNPDQNTDNAVPQATSASQPVTRPAPESGTPVAAASPSLQNARAGGNASVETPVSKSESAVPQATSASQPVTRPAPESGTPVAAASPALQNARAGGNASVATPVSKSESAVPQATSASQPVTRPAPESGTPVTAASPALQNARAGGNASVATPVSKSESAVPQATSASQPVTDVSGNPKTPFAVSSSQGLRELFMGSKEGNAENVRDINELVSSVVKNEFAAEAKKIFSKPKVIRTVADLADFILERLREIIATNQLKEKASPGKEL